MKTLADSVDKLYQEWYKQFPILKKEFPRFDVIDEGPNIVFSDPAVVEFLIILHKKGSKHTNIGKGIQGVVSHTPVNKPPWNLCVCGNQYGLKVTFSNLISSDLKWCVKQIIYESGQVLKRKIKTKQIVFKDVDI